MHGGGTGARDARRDARRQRGRCTAGITQHLMHCVNTGSWAGERGSNIAMVFKRFVENDKGEGKVHKFTVHLVRGSCLRTPP